VKCYEEYFPARKFDKHIKDLNHFSPVDYDSLSISTSLWEHTVTTNPLTGEDNNLPSALIQSDSDTDSDNTSDDMLDDDVASTEGDDYNTTPEHRVDAAGYNGLTGTNASNVTNSPDDILSPPIDHPHRLLAGTHTQLREIETRHVEPRL